MGWLVDTEFSYKNPTITRELSFLDRGTDPLVKRTPASLIYPDHWWGEKWWEQLRAASRYAHVISSITLKDPPDDKESAQEAAEVLALESAADYRSRLSEILEENEGPPAYYRRMLLADEQRNVQSGALVGRAISWSLPAVMYFKHKWKRPRPMQLEPRIRPAVDCPTHPAYPSGHSTQAHFVALVMGEVTGRTDIKNALWDAADRIAQNREYAGLHYKSDSDRGIDLAKQLLPFFIAEHSGLIAKARAEEWG